MKLTNDEVNYVKSFLQAKGYGEYEVLAEVLDHFILILEEQKEEDTKSSFEHLVDVAYIKDGRVICKEISKAVKIGANKDYNKLLGKNLIGFLYYKYVLVMGLVGVILFQLQLLIHKGNYFPNENFSGILGLTKYFIWFLGSKYLNTINENDSKFSTNKIAKRYGYFFIIGVIIIDVSLEYILKPKDFGFNIYYLASAILMIFLIVFLYALVKTVKDIVQKNRALGKVYQVLK